MSIHLVHCVWERAELTATETCILQAFADSADSLTHIAFPGQDRVQQLGRCSRSHAAEVVASLVERGYLSKHRAGHRGRRAEYVVFPDGCCAEHPRPPADDEVVDHLPKGSGGADSSSVNGSGPSDPMGKGSTPADPDSEKGSGLGPAHRTPSLTTTTSPNPATSSQGTCPAHPNGPAANCRRCGTSPRSLARQAERDAAEQRRRDSEAAIQADRRRKAETADVDAAARAAEARRLMREKAVSRG